MHKQDNPLKTVELSTEQNYNMIDGLLNNAPTLPPQPPEKELDKVKESPNKHRSREREEMCIRDSLYCGEHRSHPAAAGKRCVHRGRHRTEIQLRLEAAGLAAGAGLCILAGAGVQRH